MAWLCVNRRGEEAVCDCPPIRNNNYGVWESFTSIEGELIDFQIELPRGSIQKLIGKTLTWGDEPIQIY